MCRLAVAQDEQLGVCALEINRGGASYTVDTLRAIRASHPNAELTLIVGADTASTLPRWREPRALLDLAELAVVARSGSDEQAVRQRLQGFVADDAAGVRFLQMPPVEVSSSLARETAARGAPLAELVGVAVADYIDKHALYRDDREAA
jgi:nicotinate-nucleotide adenylyltransferase